MNPLDPAWYNACMSSSRRSVYLPDEQWSELQAFGDRLDQPVNWVVRQAVSTFLANYRPVPLVVGTPPTADGLVVDPDLQGFIDRATTTELTPIRTPLLDARRARQKVIDDALRGTSTKKGAK